MEERAFDVITSMFEIYDSRHSAVLTTYSAICDISYYNTGLGHVAVLGLPNLADWYGSDVHDWQGRDSRILSILPVVKQSLVIQRSLVESAERAYRNYGLMSVMLLDANIVA